MHWISCRRREGTVQGYSASYRSRERTNGRPLRRQAHMLWFADRQLRKVRLSCSTIARRDLPIESCGEEASLSDVCLHPKGQVQDLSCSSRCSQPVAEIDGEGLVCLSTGRREEIGAVDSGRSDLQLCHLRVNASRMLSFRCKKTRCCSDDARCFEHARSPGIRSHTNILENACHGQKVHLTAKSDF